MLHKMICLLDFLLMKVLMNIQFKQPIQPVHKDLQDGTKIIGALVAKENILVWTDNALYTMKFVGAPFTFGFEQVGTNCGLIGQNAAIEIDGVAYWMSNNGFFSFDGTVNSLPCSVEDYVYDDIDTTKGQQIAAGINNLFTEVTWWYPTSRF